MTADKLHIIRDFLIAHRGTCPEGVNDYEIPLSFGNLGMLKVHYIEQEREDKALILGAKIQCNSVDVLDCLIKAIDTQIEDIARNGEYER
jgi:metal-sulfur cluster biosynthetic enzyme